ncbi:hypothetical protein LKO27_10905 [Tessaracoccus sp. OS52]|uniref:hypothetical protein n=1 Tax=Tessaracoccus sp. OS52 TaxID=2886691 RepID=UPI001D12CB32|nr:hypothetical protein [Tessaracoccus sp. OS52]MCC2593913.1 hypothetical protein [Tessaracoccus sp. OS52]
MPSRKNKILAAWLLGLAATTLMTACGTDDPQAPAPVSSEQTGTSQPAAPAEPGDESSGEAFEGEVSTETITANMMEMEIPTGIRIPEDSLVTQAQPSVIMIADEDPAAVFEMVESSAAEAGYEVHAEVPGGKVFVGHGNAVLFTAFPNAQILTWGPEAMKDVLAES